MRPSIRRPGLALVAVMACVAAGCASSGSSDTTNSSSSAAQKRPPAKRASSYVRRVTVPNLVGERFGKAVHEVESAGLQQHAPAFTGTIGNPHYDGSCKRILSQSPPPGTRLPKGATVSIVYGVCPRAISHAHRSLRARG